MSDRVMQGAMSKRMIILPTLVPVIAMMVGCGDVDTTPLSSEEWAAICVDPRGTADPADDVRLSDDACGEPDDDGDSSHSSFFFLWSSTSGVQPVPAVGAPASKYSTHRHFPAGAYTINKLPAEGGPSLKTTAAATVAKDPNARVQRGGLGVPAGAGKAGSKAGGSAGG